MAFSRLMYFTTIVLIYGILYVFMLGCGSTKFESKGGNCSVTEQPDGALVTCQDGTSGRIYDGTNGQDGINGNDGRDGVDGEDGLDGAPGRDGIDAVIEVIDPCGDGPGADEVLLRLSTGELVAWYQGLGLSVIGEGMWVTSDQSRCVFTIDMAGNVSWL